MTVRVLIADDHPTFRSGLAAVLEMEGDIEVVGQASTGGEAIELAEALEPDVVVMDLGMPAMDGFEATRRLANAGVAVLVVTMSERDESLFGALRNGARGYVAKRADPDEIVAGVRAVAAGRTLIGSELADRLAGLLHAAGAAPTPFPQLTLREREVLNRLARGDDNSTIARTLALSPKTVRNYVSAILAKLHAADRSQAVARARDAGFGERPD